MPADEKWDINICLVAAFLAGLQSVLADVVAVVGRKDDERIIQDALCVERVDQRADHVIDAGECLQARAVEGVVRGDLCGVLLRQGQEPGGAGGGFGVEVWGARDLRRGEGGGVLGLRLRKAEDARPVADVRLSLVVGS